MKMNGGRPIIGGKDFTGGNGNGTSVDGGAKGGGVRAIGGFPDGGKEQVNGGRPINVGGQL